MSEGAGDLHTQHGPGGADGGNSSPPSASVSVLPDRPKEGVNIFGKPVPGASRAEYEHAVALLAIDTLLKFSDSDREHALGYPIREAIGRIALSGWERKWKP